MKTSNQTILAIFAHPDDEAFGPAGYIHQQKETATSHLLIATDGAYSRRYRHEPDIITRKEELKKSADLIGYKSITQLHFPDGELSNNKYHEIADQIQLVIDKLKPDVLITFEPRGVSGHLDHIATTSIVTYLFHKNKQVKKLMYFALSHELRAQFDDYFVYMPPGYHHEQLDLIVDISNSWEIKKQAIRAHGSQHTDGSQVIEKLELLPKEEHFLVITKEPI